MRLSRLLFIPLLLLSAGAWADTNLALTCWNAKPPAAKPSSCPQGWTWQIPKLNSMVITQGGSWRQITSPLSAEPITVCKANVSVGSARASCPAASVAYLAPCNVAGQTPCVAPPKPPVVYTDGTATVTWTNPTTDTNGKPIAISALEIFRGTKADGSNLAHYSGVGAVNAVIYNDIHLTEGPWCYALKAYGPITPPATKGEPSEMSNVGCKTVVAPKDPDPEPLAQIPNPPVITKVE